LEMAKTRDRLYCERGITDTMIEEAVCQWDLENDSEFCALMRGQEKKMAEIMKEDKQK